MEWYSPALRDGENMIRVARHSVADTVRALEANPAVAEAIGRAGREIHDTFLCPICLANWLKTTLEAYHEHLGLGRVLDDPGEASNFFRAHLPCDRMIELTREGHPRVRPMNADDPVHPCRKGGLQTNASWWAADNTAALGQLRRAEAGEVPLKGTARKHLGVPQ